MNNTPLTPELQAEVDRAHAPIRIEIDAVDAQLLHLLNERAKLAQSAQAGLAALKEHKMVGGMRASIYNAVSLEAVQALVGFMGEFEKQHG